MSGLLALPKETLTNVLSYVEPVDLARFAQTCRSAQNAAHPANQVLWRHVFLSLYDDPEEAWSAMPSSYTPPLRKDWDWYREVKHRHGALCVLHRQNLEPVEPAKVNQHITSLLSILDTAKFAPTPSEIRRGMEPRINDRSWLNLNLLAPRDTPYHTGIDSLIYGHSLRDCEGYTSRPSDSRSDAKSRLHILCGLTERDHMDHKVRGQARRRVYNWSLTSEATDYGPFMDDGSGRPNWYLLEGVVTVSMLMLLSCVQQSLVLPNSFNYSIPHRTLVPYKNPRDWARVQGSWLGTYSFLDYAQLAAFNDRIRPNSIGPNLEGNCEACGALLKMVLRIDDSVKSDRKLQTSLPSADDADYPTLYFRGESKDRGHAGNPATTVKGFAALMPGGREVRWRFIVNYMSTDAWQLEGIQPGGIRSGGIFGLWSQVDHEPRDAIGPFCYYPEELFLPLLNI
ncbi:hypothetical protein DV736_g5016, partial [Chaetothyriales sp. CBS 134916]